MGRAFALTLLLLAGCASPDERFWLSGTVLGSDGLAAAGAKVRLARAASFDGLRCTPMEPLSATTTDARGVYTFSLSRQQITAGSGAPRPFRLETDTHDGGRASYTFLMPQGDLTLPELSADFRLHPPAGFTAPVEAADEAFVDGWLAWRGGSSDAITEDRAGVERTLERQLDSFLAVSDDLGSQSYVAVDLRVEGPPRPRYLRSSPAPFSRGASCEPAVDGDACPLTDGRFMPVVLPAGTERLTFDFGAPRNLRGVAVRSLDVPGGPTRLVVDTARDATSAFDSLMVFRLDPGRVQNAALSCDEPGIFASFALPSLGLPPARRARVSVVDAQGARLPIRSVAEVSFE